MTRVRAPSPRQGRIFGTNFSLCQKRIPQKVTAEIKGATSRPSVQSFIIVLREESQVSFWTGRGYCHTDGRNNQPGRRCPQTQDVSRLSSSWTAVSPLKW